jgi:hypothetical protein
LYSDEHDKDRKKAGVGIFMLPTQTPYHIDIKFDKATMYHLYTINSIKVGQRKVAINGGKPIFYSSDTMVKGFETGSNESFKFYSPSEFERINMRDKIPKGHNVTNVIEIRLQEYRKVYMPPTRSFGGYEDDCELRTCSVPDADDDDDEYRPSGISNLGMREFGCSVFGSAQTYSTLSAQSYSSQSFSGGSTIPGGMHVPHVKTVPFHHETEAIGLERVITIQLACDQPEDVKCSSNLQAILCSTGAGTVIKRYEDGSKALEKMKTEMKQLESKLDIYLAIRQEIEKRYDKEIEKLRELKPNETELLPASAYTTTLPNDAPDFVKEALGEVRKVESKSLLLSLS